MEKSDLHASGSIIWHGLLFVAEIIFGLRTHSICLLVHGLHTLYKAAEEVIIIICAKIPQTGTRKNTFGWARTHVLGVTINSVFLAALCFSMFVSSLKRLVATEHLHDHLIIVIIGAVGIVSGIISLAVAQTYHLCSSDEKLKKEEPAPDVTPSERELFIKRKGQLASHSVIDKRWTLTSMGGALVILVNGLIHVFEDDPWTHYVDAVSSIIMVIIIIGGTLPQFKDACMVLMQAAPTHIEMDELAEKMKKSVPGIESIHEFHLWQLTGRHVVATVHVKLKGLGDFVRVAEDVKNFLTKEGVHSVTVQPEIDTTPPASSEELDQDFMMNGCVIDCGPACIKKKCCNNCHEGKPEQHQV
ncbi:proton-coupled zinc antiporter SLC30A1-like [Lineus longissimus]|uniref:proton-coupled zinc antiporter SLC30A1-like n=1 Tax=Lineus longissimus TaxID=88925 RepID=UPI002B4D283C